MTVSLRPMAAADALGLGAMHHQAWIDTYGEVLGESYFTQRWTVDDAVARWETVLAAAPEPGVVRLVAHEGTSIVGFVAAGPSRTMAKRLEPARDLELWGIYVAQPRLGSGLGQRLLDAAIRPGAPAELWVFRDNRRARAFYARNGFQPDGAGFTDVRHPELPEIRLVR